MAELGRRSKLTENTIKKNGLKWSNISVKKYHQSPGFGVKSGRVSLKRQLLTASSKAGFLLKLTTRPMSFLPITNFRKLEWTQR